MANGLAPHTLSPSHTRHRAPCCAAGLVLFALALVPGCYESHPGVAFPGLPDGGADASRVDPDGDVGVAPLPLSGQYVVSFLSIPRHEGGRAPGANIDGIDSAEGSTSPDADCQELHPDFVSSTDGLRGVDDALAAFVDMLDDILGKEDAVDGLLADSIASGSMSVGLAFGSGGEARAYLLVPSAPLRIGEDRRIEPDQHFVPVQAVGEGTARRHGARVAVRFSGLSLEGPDPVVPLLPLGLLRDVEVRFAHDDDGLRAGELGARVTVDDAVRSARDFMPGMEGSLRVIYESIADLRPSEEDRRICGSMSVGMRFEAVPAVFDVP
jgi:hypothetical protein